MTSPRDAFLDMVADAKEFSIDYDADTNESGRQIDCSTFTIRGDLQSLIEFLESINIERKSYDEAWEVALYRAVEAEDVDKR